MNSISTVRFPFSFRAWKHRTSHTFPFFVFVFLFYLAHLWRCLTSDRSKRIQTFSHKVDRILLESFICVLGFLYNTAIYYMHKVLFKILCHFTHYILPADTERQNRLSSHDRDFFFFFSYFFSYVHAICAAQITVHFFITTNIFLNLCMKAQQLIYATESPDSLLRPQ